MRVEGCRRQGRPLSGSAHASASPLLPHLACILAERTMAALSSALQRLQSLVDGRAFESVASTLSSFDPHLEAAAHLVDLSRSAAEAGGSGGNGLRAGFQRFGADRP